jgi:hypothetical protein
LLTIDEGIMDKNDPVEKNIDDKLYSCPNCEKAIIRVGCHAICKHCGYQEGCGD